MAGWAADAVQCLAMANHFTMDWVSRLAPEGSRVFSIEISYRGQRLCAVRKPTPQDDVEVEVLYDLLVLSPMPEMRFPLRELEAALQEARREWDKADWTRQSRG